MSTNKKHKKNKSKKLFLHHYPPDPCINCYSHLLTVTTF